MAKDSSYFVADFNDGYSLRNTLEYLKNTNSSGVLKFFPDKIVYEQSDKTKVIVNKIEINTSDLAHYEFYSENNLISIGLNISDVLSVTKTIGKKDGVRFYKLKDEQYLYIQIISQSSNAVEKDNVSIIKPQQINLLPFEEPEYERSERTPNAAILSSKFSKLCKALSALKCETITVIGYPEGITFASISQGVLIGRIEKIGNVDDEPIDSCIENMKRPLIKIRCSTMKSLGKIGNLCTTGMVKMFIEHGKPLKLISKIGNYGTLKSFIYSYDKK